MVDALNHLGLQDLNLNACEVSDLWKDRLLRLVESYETAFSRDKMDYGEAMDFVHFVLKELLSIVHISPGLGVEKRWQSAHLY